MKNEKLQFDLSDLNVLVTGASIGIGAAIAKYLIRQGARVGVHYNRNKDAAQQIVEMDDEGKAYAFGYDLEDVTEVKGLFKAATAKFDQLDTLVLNAGVFLPHAVDLDTDAWFEIWKRTLRINLDAVGILTKLAIDHFKEQGGGRLVYIGSRAVFRGETQEYMGYAASKGGITSLARTVARSFGKDNIKAFVVSPGFTRTQMAEQFIAEYGEDRVLKEIALNELTEPEDIAPLVALMCSGLMDHATGATIDVNAGSHIR